MIFMIIKLIIFINLPISSSLHKPWLACKLSWSSPLQVVPALAEEHARLMYHDHDHDDDDHTDFDDHGHEMMIMIWLPHQLETQGLPKECQPPGKLLEAPQSSEIL